MLKGWKSEKIGRVYTNKYLWGNLSANVNFVDNFKIITKYQIYNPDETGLNFEMLLRKSLASRDEKRATGTK